MIVITKNLHQKPAFRGLVSVRHVVADNQFFYCNAVDHTIRRANANKWPGSCKASSAMKSNRSTSAKLTIYTRRAIEITVFGPYRTRYANMTKNTAMQRLILIRVLTRPGYKSSSNNNVVDPKNETTKRS